MHYFGTLVPKGDYMDWQTSQENIYVNYKNEIDTVNYKIHFDLTVKFRK